MELRLEIPKEVSKDLKIFKIKNDFGNQQDAIIFILKERFKEDNGDPN
jgi:hypothetical protein